LEDFELACLLDQGPSKPSTNSEPASVSTWQPSISMAATPFALLLWEMLRHHHFVLPSCNSEPVSLSSWQPSISSMAASFATITSCQVGAATLTANNGVASSQPVFSSSDF